MDNRAVVEHIMKNLDFDLETVSKSRTTDVTTSSKGDPLSVKIKVRKKDVVNETYTQGFISNNLSRPEMVLQKVRLVNSDETIMSFDMFMEAGHVKKKTRKSRKYIFGLCLGAADDDEDPYIRDVNENNSTSKSDETLRKPFTLKKNTYQYFGVSDTTKRDKYFLGKKCKPGGCLDPAFDEDYYPYKPSVQLPSSNEQENPLKVKPDETNTDAIKDIKSANKSKKSSKDISIKSTDAKVKESDTISSLYEVRPLRNSIMTYPSDDEYQAHRSKGANEEYNRIYRNRTSSEVLSRQSVNGSMNSFFSLPKGTKRVSSNITQQEATHSQSFNQKSVKNKALELLSLPIPASLGSGPSRPNYAFESSDDNKLKAPYTIKLSETYVKNDSQKPITPIVLVPPIVIPFLIKSDTIEAETISNKIKPQNLPIKIQSIDSFHKKTTTNDIIIRPSGTSNDQIEVQKHHRKIDDKNEDKYHLSTSKGQNIISNQQNNVQISVHYDGSELLNKLSVTNKHRGSKSINERDRTSLSKKHESELIDIHTKENPIDQPRDISITESRTTKPVDISEMKHPILKDIDGNNNISIANRHRSLPIEETYQMASPENQVTKYKNNEINLKKNVSQLENENKKKSLTKHLEEEIILNKLPVSTKKIITPEVNHKNYKYDNETSSIRSTNVMLASDHVKDRVKEQASLARKSLNDNKVSHMENDVPKELNEWPNLEKNILEDAKRLSQINIKGTETDDTSHKVKLTMSQNGMNADHKLGSPYTAGNNVIQGIKPITQIRNNKDILETLDQTHISVNQVISNTDNIVKQTLLTPDHHQDDITVKSEKENYFNSKQDTRKVSPDRKSTAHDYENTNIDSEGLDQTRILSVNKDMCHTDNIAKKTLLTSNPPQDAITVKSEKENYLNSQWGERKFSPDRKSTANYYKQINIDSKSPNLTRILSVNEDIGHTDNITKQTLLTSNQPQDDIAVISEQENYSSSKQGERKFSLDRKSTAHDYKQINIDSESLNQTRILSVNEDINYTDYNSKQRLLTSNHPQDNITVNSEKENYLGSKQGEKKISPDRKSTAHDYKQTNIDSESLNQTCILSVNEDISHTDINSKQILLTHPQDGITIKSEKENYLSSKQGERIFSPDRKPTGHDYKQINTDFESLNETRILSVNEDMSHTDNIAKQTSLTSYDTQDDIKVKSEKENYLNFKQDKRKVSPDRISTTYDSKKNNIDSVTSKAHRFTPVPYEESQKYERMVCGETKTSKGIPEIISAASDPYVANSFTPTHFETSHIGEREFSRVRKTTITYNPNIINNEALDTFDANSFSPASNDISRISNKNGLICTNYLRESPEMDTVFSETYGHSSPYSSEKSQKAEKNIISDAKPSTGNHDIMYRVVSDTYAHTPSPSHSLTPFPFEKNKKHEKKLSSHRKSSKEIHLINRGCSETYDSHSLTPTHYDKSKKDERKVSPDRNRTIFSLDNNGMHLKSPFKSKEKTQFETNIREKIISPLQKPTNAVSLNLAFHVYLNKRNERVINTIETMNKVKRYPNDSLVYVQSQLKLSPSNENCHALNIPIDSTTNLAIEIKKSNEGQSKDNNRKDTRPIPKVLQTDVKSSTSPDRIKRVQLEMNKHDKVNTTLTDLYERQLLPLQTMIRGLRQEVDSLTGQQVGFKKKPCYPKKIKCGRIVTGNRRCIVALNHS